MANLLGSRHHWFLNLIVRSRTALNFNNKPIETKHTSKQDLTRFDSVSSNFETLKRSWVVKVVMGR